MSDKVHISYLVDVIISIDLLRHECKDQDQNHRHQDPNSTVEFRSTGCPTGEAPDNGKDDGQDDDKCADSNSSNTLA